MAKSSSSNDAVDPAHDGPGGTDAPSGSVDAMNLGSVGAFSRGSKSRRVPPLRDRLDALYRDKIAVSEAERRGFDGPGPLWREELPPEPQLAASMEAMGVTARVMAVMNWLLAPAHDREVTAVRPIDCPEPSQLPADHLLPTTDGGPIAEASRHLLVRTHQLVREYGDAA